MKRLFSLLALMALGFLPADVWAAERPNLILILADDLAQGDLGCYGQKIIRTPNLDRLASEGLRCTQAYCGTAVCAPSRTALMTGLHTGHAPVRGNREIKPEGQMPLPANTVTVAEVLKKAGYATACIGKWGMGMFDSTGSPLRKGFDHFYGYNCQRHAHRYFPEYLYDDDRRVEFPENAAGGRKTYAQNRIADETLRWVRQQAGHPFFLYYAVTLPHGAYEIDDLGEYASQPWTEQEKTYAAMVTRLDRDVGRLTDLLRELKLDRNTLVLFTADNGSAFAPESPLARRFDQAAAGLRGFKRGLYEGALRNAGIAWWPGTIAPGRVSHEPWASWDYLPTAAELAGVPVEGRTDGLSLAGFLKGGPAPKRECFYWELHEGRFTQAVRFGDWKAVRPAFGKPLELYDLAKDPGEQTDVAGREQAVVARAEAFMAREHVDDPLWPAAGAGPARSGKAK